MKVTQEFYCGECSGYFLIKLNALLTFEVEIICPSCGHMHRRCIKEGQIFENGRYNTDVREEIATTIATYSKEPCTGKMKDAHAKKSFNARRDGVPVFDDEMKQRWLEKAEAEKGGHI